MPHSPEDYVHRIGRTGRAGLPGEAISLVAPQDHDGMAAIERLIKKRIERQLIPGFGPSGASLAPLMGDQPSRREQRRPTPKSRSPKRQTDPIFKPYEPQLPPPLPLPLPQQTRNPRSKKADASNRRSPLFLVVLNAPNNTARAVDLDTDAADEFRFIRSQIKTALATSSGVEKRPSGTVARKRFLASSVTAPPANSAESEVSGLNTGLTQFTRMRSGPNSAAIDFDIRITAPLELL